MVECEPAAVAIPAGRHAGFLCDVDASGAVRHRAGDEPRRAVGGRHVAVDAGGQLDFRVTMLSVLDLTLSVGGAMAFEDGQRAPARGDVLAEGPAMTHQWAGPCLA